MQQAKERILSSLVVISLTLAALCAPPSVFAETVPQVPTPPVETTPAEPPLPPVPAPVAGSIRIGLATGLTAADVAAPGGLYLIGDGAMQAQLDPGQSVTLALEAGQIKVAGLEARFAEVRLVPVSPAAAETPAPALPIPTATVPPKPVNPITYKEKPYRGEIAVVVAPVSKRLSVVNVVNLEEYLLGVVPEEVYYTWPLEAIKAQAVAARTYALANLGKRKNDGFDLVSTTSDQFYGGLDSERLQASQAVAMTRGQVLTYGGKPISAMYHSSSGGHTENNEIIYASLPVAYLRGVKDFDNVPGNSYYSWEYKYTLADFSQMLKTLGYDVGTVTAITPVGVQESASGRPRQFIFTGTAGTQTLTGSQVRDNLTLPGNSRAKLSSNPRTISLLPGGFTPTVKTYTDTQTYAVVGAGGAVQERPVSGSAVIAAGQSPTVVTGAVTAMGARANQAGGVVVSGGGHGHAVGMSQWGAYGMALLGKNYTEILTHYYTGTKLETRQTE